MTSWAGLPIDLLPPLLQDFVRLIDLPATMALVEKFGGVRLYVPKHPKADHPIAELIGLDKLEALSKVYGREEHFQLPKADRALRALRNAALVAQYGPKSARTLALEYRVTERYVVMLATDAKRKREASPGLFD